MADLVSIAIILAKVLGIAIGGFIAGKLVYRVVLAVAKKVTAKTATTLDDYILQYIEGPLDAAMIVFFIYAFSGVLEDLAGLRSLMTTYSLAILVVLGAYAISELIGGILRWAYEKGKEKRANVDVTLIPFARKVSSVLIMFFGITTALAIVGLDVGGLLAVTSVVALVLGLASQETLANIFAGLALQLDRPYAYDDYLKLPDGSVVRLLKIGLRSTKLDDLSGSTVVISNSEFAKTRVINLSKPGREFKVVLPIEVPMGTKIASFEEYLFKELGKKESNVKDGRAKITVDKVNALTVTLNVSFYAADFEEAGKAKDYANRKALEFFSRKQ